MHTFRRFGFFLVFFLAVSLIPPQGGTAAPPTLIRIFSPGEGSAVHSPIELTATIHPGGDGLVRVALVNRQSLTLARQLIQTDVQKGSPVQFSTHLAFEIPTDSTTALLTVSIQDEHHRPLSLRSVLLNLETDGITNITASEPEMNWLKIDQPLSNASLSGGSFDIEGSVTPLTQKPIIFELITDSGGVIGLSQLPVETPGQPFNFSIPISYAFITTKRNVRMVVRQTIDPYGVNVILDSLALTLAP